MDTGYTHRKEYIDTGYTIYVRGPIYFSLQLSFLWRTQTSIMVICERRIINCSNESFKILVIYNLRTFRSLKIYYWKCIVAYVYHWGQLYIYWARKSQTNKLVCRGTTCTCTRKKHWRWAFWRSCGFQISFVTSSWHHDKKTFKFWNVLW